MILGVLPDAAGLILAMPASLLDCHSLIWRKNFSGMEKGFRGLARRALFFFVSGNCWMFW